LRGKLNIILAVSVCIALAFGIYAMCVGTGNDEADKGDTGKTSHAEMTTSLSEYKETSNTEKSSGKSEKDDSQELPEDVEELPEEELEFVSFNFEDAFSYCKNPVCRYSRDENSVIFTFDYCKGVPKSDDDYLYLFEFATYEKEELINEKRPVSTIKKKSEGIVSLPFTDRHLFARFVPAILYEGEYVPLCVGQYITNPEELAENCEPIPQLGSKKGLLLDANTIDTDYLYDLDVERIVFNIPLSLLIGETESPECPTVDFNYNGKTYHFNGYRLAGYDSLFKYLTEKGYYSTAIILNDWNKKYPEIMHPQSRRRTGRSMYYAFNTEEEDGVRLMEAAALFLADRYSGGEYGMVHEWVIANEINQKSIWNYMATSDLEYYTESFEKSFRTFYNAIRSNYSNAKVYFSIDHDWNNNGGNNGWFFNGRDLLESFNSYARLRGDYDWSLSIHPYPSPLTKVRFWNGEFDKTENARVITPMNLSSLTDVMTKDEFLNTKGEVRDIAVTELGFSSRAGEELQAAAFAYCYYIIEDNEYISSFLLNRQTDDTESLKSGLALGIYNNDYSSKALAEVFKNVDSDAGREYINEMLKIIGEESLETALNKAR